MEEALTGQTATARISGSGSWGLGVSGNQVRTVEGRRQDVNQSKADLIGLRFDPLERSEDDGSD